MSVVLLGRPVQVAGYLLVGAQLLQGVQLPGQRLVGEQRVNLPVARAVWEPRPDLRTAATAWIHAGGAHHTALSFDLTVEHLTDFADMAGMELLVIDEGTTVRGFRQELRWNDVYYRLAGGI